MTVNLTTTITATDLKLLEDIYTSSFPVEERRPWDEIISGNCNPQLYAIIADAKIIGLVTLWRFKQFAYIEHLAIDKVHRDSGLGSKAVELVLEETGILPVVLEIEPPCNEHPETVRRRDFYRRLGFDTIDTAYVQPPYSPGLPEVPLHLMATTPLSASAVTKVLHQNVYGK